MSGSGNGRRPDGAGIAAHPLHRLFEPRGVALVGASQDPAKYGAILLDALVDHGYPGGIYPVNPGGGERRGRRFLASLDEADGPIDVALIVRPAPEVPEAVRAVAARRIPFVIVYAAGFAEHSEAGRRLEHRMVEAARAAGTRLVGPNCMNIWSVPARLNLSAIAEFRPGALAFLSASGNLGFALAHEAGRRGGPGFSRFISAGNQADLAFDDYLDFLRVDPATRVVLIFTEGFVADRAARFLETLRRTAAEKPVVVLCGARTAEGKRTAGSHTGALAGRTEVMREALEQAGALILDRADEALAIAAAFLDSPLPAGAGVALAGEGGGHATLLTDAVCEAGLRLDPYPDEMIAGFRGHLPPFASIVANPVEMAGRTEYDAALYRKILAPVFDWPGCDQVILFGGYSLYDEPLAEFLAGRRAGTGKPVLAHDLYADEDRPGIRALRAHGVPVYASAELAARAAGALWRGARARQRARRALEWKDGIGRTAPLPDDLRSALATARHRRSRALTEDEAVRLLAHFGVPVPPARLARDEGEAVHAAGQIGFPVVLKIHSADIVHKTEAAGVHLDLRSADEVRRAYRAVIERRAGAGREVRLTPFLPGGVECIAGARRDPDYGPILLFGAGGVLAEVARDTAIRTLPCPDGEIDEMIAATRAGRLLAGHRGAAAADRRAIAAILRALGRIVLALPEVCDVEINPLRCAADGAVPLDARVLVESTDESPGQRTPGDIRGR